MTWRPCFCHGSARRFFGRRRIGAMADHRHHGECEHHHRDVAMPAMPGSALVVIEPELILGSLKTVLDRPAMAFDCDQRFNGRSCWAPGGEEGEVIICDATTDQSPATHSNGTDAAMARSIILVASFGLVAKPVSGGTYAASRRSGSSVHSFGRYSARSMNAWPWRET